MKTLWPDASELAIATDHQREKYALATRGPVAILGGNPGTGKSFLGGQIIKCVAAKYGLSNIAVCAFTGKAAQVITEVMIASDINLQATTIHRMLGPQRNGHDKKGWGFLHNARFPLQKRFVFCDECFVRGTLVDTPNGQVPIESVKPNSEILNAVGIDKVVATKKTEVSRVAHIVAGKTSFYCSENHPFFTRRGVVFARNIVAGDRLVETTEAVRLLRNNDQSETGSRSKSFLQRVLLNEMVDAVPIVSGENPQRRNMEKERRWPKAIPSLGYTGGDCTSRSHTAIESHVESGICRQDEGQFEANWSPSAGSRRERDRVDGSTREVIACVGSRVGGRSVVTDPDSKGLWISNNLQNRRGESSNDDRNRDRRPVAQVDCSPRYRCQENESLGFSRVDAVEILECGDPRLDRFRDADGKLYLYDLKAAQHQSFSVSGVLVHNSSMLGTTIGSSLLDACFPGTHFMPMGDCCQLPPVEHGAFLRDAIASGLPYGELTEIIRNAGDVVQACQDVKDGRQFTPSRYVDLDAGKNFRHIQCSRPSMALSALQSMFRSPPPGVDPMWDIQVLCAVNDNTEVCRKKLNGLVQRILNPHDPGKPEHTKGHTTYRRDDKVICLSNGMIPLAHCPRCVEAGGQPDFSWDGKGYECMSCGHAWAPKECAEDFVANGEIGKVIAVRDSVIHVRFDSPARTVRVSGEWLGAFDLAYAVTTHKSQGSAWPVVIVMADDSFAADRVTSWEHHRTSWSRMRKLVISIGNIEAVHRQCRRSALAGRKTFLPAMVKRLMGVSHAE